MVKFWWRRQKYEHVTKWLASNANPVCVWNLLFSAQTDAFANILADFVAFYLVFEIRINFIIEY